MTETCDHHWHPNGSGADYTKNERWDRSVCCHCGDTKETRRPLYGSGGWSSGDREACGPHKPDVNPRWGA